jgi:hypothetical protein
MKDPAGRARAVFRLVCALDLLAVFVLLLVVVERSPLARPLSDQGVPIGMAVLFVAIPAGALVAWRLGRGAPPPSPRRRVFYALSRLGLTLAWLPSALVALLLVTVVQPWPLSLRQGPDTGYAREGFARHLRFEPPPSVKDLMYRGEGLRDATYWITFACDDPAVVERIAQELSLEPVAGPIRDLGDPYTRRPIWWGRDAGAEPDRAWERGEVRYLWYDSARGRAFYEERHL